MVRDNNCVTDVIAGFHCIPVRKCHTTTLSLSPMILTCRSAMYNSTLTSSDASMICNIPKNHTEIEQVEQSSDNRCVLWRNARVLVFELSFKWHTFLFLMLFCPFFRNSIHVWQTHFSEIQFMCDEPTDQRSNVPTDRRTDGPMIWLTDGRTDGHALL